MGLLGDRSRAAICLGSIGAAGLLAIPAFAQQVPPPTTPQGLPTRQQVETPTPPPQPPAPTASVDASKAVRTAPCPLADSQLRVTLAGVRFTGPNGAPLAPELAAVLQGIKVPTGDAAIAVVCDVRDQANLALQRARYVASVQVPPQNLESGMLTLTVISAHITEIRVHGEPGRYRETLLRRIEQIKALDPLNARDAERILLLAGDVPGLDVQLSLRPAGTAPGDVIGDLTVTTRRFAILGNVQNYGSNELGRWTGYLRGEAYGLLTNSDILYGGVSTTAQTREQQVAQVGYITGLGHRGLTVGGRFTYAWSRPDLDLLDLRSRSLIGGLDLTYPIVRTIDRNFSVAGGGEIIEQRTKVYGGGSATPLNLDKLRVGYLRMSGNVRFRRPSGRELLTIAASVEERKGLDILDSTKRGTVTTIGYSPSRFDGDPEAWVLRGDADAVLSLGLVSFAGSLRSQWSNHALLNFEEYTVGNLTIGRGYDPGANSGDRALGLRAEGRVNLPITEKVPVQLFAFGDYLRLWNLDQNSTEAHRLLRSYGGGIRFSLPNRALLDVMYAKPVDKALSFDDGPPKGRVLVSLTAQFTPPAR